MSSHRLPVEKCLDRSPPRFNSRHFWASFFLVEKNMYIGPRFVDLFVVCSDYFVVVSYLKEIPNKLGIPKKPWTLVDPFLLRYAKNCAKHVGEVSPKSCSSRLGFRHPSCHFMPCLSISNDGKISQPTKKAAFPVSPCLGAASFGSSLGM